MNFMQHPEIYLVRHGETEWNVSKHYQGQLDSRLTANGENQAAAMGKHLADVFTKQGDTPFYSSPLGRCRQTAAIICEKTTFKSDRIIHDDRLMEVHCGHWQTFTRQEVSEKWPEEWVQRRANTWNYAIPGGGESGSMLQARAKDWLENLPQTSPILVVAHGMIGMMIRGLCRGLAPNETLSLEAPQGVIVHLKDGIETLLKC